MTALIAFITTAFIGYASLLFFKYYIISIFTLDMTHYNLLNDFQASLYIHSTNHAELTTVLNSI